MFRTSQLMVISKCDLLPYVPFKVDEAINDARLIQPDMISIQTSAIHDEGLSEWCQFLENARAEMLSSRDTAAALGITPVMPSVLR